MNVTRRKDNPLCQLFVQHKTVSSVFFRAKIQFYLRTMVWSRSGPMLMMAMGVSNSFSRKAI